MLMIARYFIILAAVAAAAGDSDAATKQLVYYEGNKTDPIETMTTAAGEPVEYNDVSTLNTDLLNNAHFIDEMTSMDRERLPERIVHAGGVGAFGYFETTHDITNICKAKLFSEVGKKTPVVARLSITAPRSGSRDTLNGTPRGLAVKFYTEEGNFDLPGLSTPMFAFRDPLLFSGLSHILKPNPVTNLPDPNAAWDFLTQNPETLFENLYVLSDYGSPLSYRHMASFPIHTYQVYNEEGVSSFVRFHFLPDAGIKNFNATGFAAISIGDPDYYARDLYNAIANDNYPSWTMKVQVLSEEDVKNADYDVFDVTRIISSVEVPLQTVGILHLNKIPDNHFANVEQVAFCPGNLVPGVVGGPDKLFQGRVFSYRDAQLYRLGNNFKKIPVNCPIQSQAHTYLRDGPPPVNDNGRDAPNYYPNSFKGPAPYEDKNRPKLININETKPDNFEQAGNFYSNDLNTDEKSTLVANVVSSLCSCETFIKERAVYWLTIINSDLGSRVADGLAASCT